MAKNLYFLLDMDGCLFTTAPGGTIQPKHPMIIEIESIIAQNIDAKVVLMSFSSRQCPGSEVNSRIKFHHEELYYGWVKTSPAMLELFARYLSIKYKRVVFVDPFLLGDLASPLSEKQAAVFGACYETMLVDGDYLSEYIKNPDNQISCGSLYDNFLIDKQAMIEYGQAHNKALFTNAEIQKILESYFNGTNEREYTFLPDKNKLTFVYFFAQYIAHCDKGGINAIFLFDDNQTIINNNYNFYSHNPAFLPFNISVSYYLFKNNTCNLQKNPILGSGSLINFLDFYDNLVDKIIWEPGIVENRVINKKNLDVYLLENLANTIKTVLQSNPRCLTGLTVIAPSNLRRFSGIAEAAFAPAPVPVPVPVPVSVPAPKIDERSSLRPKNEKKRTCPHCCTIS